MMNLDLTAMPEQRQEQRVRLLVIDDDPQLLAILEQGLRLMGGYDVYTALDGIAGLYAIPTFGPDCVLTDIRMPGLTGYQLVRLLRGDPQTAQLPIVVLSVLTHDHEAIAGLVTGADAYLFKPVHLADVQRAVHEAIALAPEERQQRRLRWLETGL